jgi:hypothetical protein
MRASTAASGNQTRASSVRRGKARIQWKGHGGREARTGSEGGDRRIAEHARAPRSARISPARCVLLHLSRAAVKCIRRDKLTPEDLAALAIEVKAMQLLKENPYFIKYVDFFTEK